MKNIKKIKNYKCLNDYYQKYINIKKILLTNRPRL